MANRRLSVNTDVSENNEVITDMILYRSCMHELIGFIEAMEKVTVYRCIP